VRVPEIISVYYDFNPVKAWGCPTRPLILIFPNGLSLGGNKINVQIYGDLIVKGNFTMNGQGGTGSNGSSLKIYKDSNGQYGNLIATGNLSYDNPATTIVQGDIRSSSVSVKGNLSAANLYAASSTTIAENSIIAVTDGSIYSTSFELKGSSQVTTKNLYATSALSTSSSGKFTVTGNIHASSFYFNESTIVTAQNMYTTGPLTLSQTGKVTATGDIFVNSLTQSGASTVKAANLYITNNLALSNDGKIDVAGITLANDATMNTSQTQIKSGKLILTGNLSMPNQGSVQLTSDLLIGGSVDTHTSGSSITSSGGDIFIKGNLDSQNNVTLKSGGVIAVGGDMKINKWSGAASVVQTGGGTTSYIQADSSGGSSGGGGSGGSPGSGTPAAWKPTRITH
jgi:hypothetical protein